MCTEIAKVQKLLLEWEDSIPKDGVIHYSGNVDANGEAIITITKKTEVTDFGKSLYAKCPATVSAVTEAINFLCSHKEDLLPFTNKGK